MTNSRFKIFTFLLVFVFAGAGYAQTQKVKPIDNSVEGKRAFEGLAKFYEDLKQVPPYEKALKTMNTSGAEQDDAARFIFALFKQSLADETNGRCHWQQTPFWGESSQSYARNFRQKLAKTFGHSASGDRALDIAFWLICNDRSKESQKAALAVFQRGDDKYATNIYKRVLELPYSMNPLTPAIIDRVSTLDLTQLLPEITALQNHYRKSVRRTARRAIREFEQSVDPSNEQDFTPWLEQQLKSISQMLYYAVPADSKFSRITLEKVVSSQKIDSGMIDGWITKQSCDTVEIIDTFGCRKIFPTKPSSADSPTIVAINIVPYGLQNEATDLMATREQVDHIASLADQQSTETRFIAQQKLSIDGIFSAQFESSIISVPEALVATWCHQHGYKDVAAKLLFPRIDAMDDDRDLLATISTVLPVPYYHAMLSEFADEHDYRKAIAIGDHLLKPQFKDCWFRPQVSELSHQLENRLEDFKTFVIPTLTDWKKMKEKMSIQEQVCYLAPRLRLLVCKQYSQPGGLDFAEAQKDVINPYVELSEIIQTSEQARMLIPFLDDSDFILGISFFRDFHPSRSLHRVNELVADILNRFAHKPLIDVVKYEKLSENGKKTYIQNAFNACGWP